MLGCRGKWDAHCTGEFSEVAIRDLRNTQHRQSHSFKMSQSDEEDDYMNMVFEDAPKGPKFETSLQRAARKRKEVRTRFEDGRHAD
jgi:hypothetical protein